MNIKNREKNALTNNETGFVLRPSRPSANAMRSCSTRLLLASAHDNLARNSSSGWFAISCGLQCGQLPANIYDNVIPLGPLPGFKIGVIKMDNKNRYSMVNLFDLWSID